MQVLQDTAPGYDSKCHCLVFVMRGSGKKGAAAPGVLCSALRLLTGLIGEARLRTWKHLRSDLRKLRNCQQRLRVLEVGSLFSLFFSGLDLLRHRGFLCVALAVVELAL